LANPTIIDDIASKGFLSKFILYSFHELHTLLNTKKIENPILLKNLNQAIANLTALIPKPQTQFSQ
jgi:hypothetical protein